jgi:uncharacterized membrane protein YccC
VENVATVWTKLRTLVRQHRVQLGLSFRVTVASLLALAIAQFLDLHLPLWAVLTSIIVTQASVGRSLKVTLDYLAGTLGGALYGGAVAVLIPHSTETALLAVLAIAVIPLAFAAAINPSLNSAPVTAVIVLLVPTLTHVTPIASAFDRVLEVGVGAVTGLAVSFLLLPSSAHRLVIDAAARTLDRMAQTLGELLAGLGQGLDMPALHRIQDGIGRALVQLDAIGSEAERERTAFLTNEPDMRPLLRTLLRLRHDLVMIGRAAIVPLPDAFRMRLQAPLARVGTTAADYMRASGAALLARRDPPSLEDLETALEAYAAEIVAVRAEGLTRDLPGDAAERFFAIGFALEQMHQNFNDLKRCVAEWAAPKSLLSGRAR